MRISCAGARVRCMPNARARARARVTRVPTVGARLAREARGLSVRGYGDCSPPEQDVSSETQSIGQHGRAATALAAPHASGLPAVSLPIATPCGSAHSRAPGAPALFGGWLLDSTACQPDGGLRVYLCAT
jgi:hypothetical protein